MKYLKIILFNILLIIISFAIVEILTCFYVIKKYNVNIKEHYSLSYILQQKHVHRLDLTNYFTEQDNVNYGRTPDGLQYKGKPIIIFGCSFAYGQYLDKSETLSALLSKKLKRPVYNRAVPAQGLQEMYYQSTSKDFYNDVKDPDTIIYVMINDQYRRMDVDYFDIPINCRMLSYKIRKNNLIMKDYTNPVANLFRALYSVIILQHKYINSYISNDVNIPKITDDALLYFLKTRENIEKHYNHKVRFCVIFYNDDRYGDVLLNKLKQNNFIVMKANELTEKNLNAPPYIQPDAHPSKDAWEVLITPIIHAIFNPDTNVINNY